MSTPTAMPARIPRAHRRRHRAAPHVTDGPAQHYWFYLLGDVVMAHGTTLAEAEHAMSLRSRERDRPSLVRQAPCDCPVAPAA